MFLNDEESSMLLQNSQSVLRLMETRIGVAVRDMLAQANVHVQDVETERLRELLLAEYTRQSTSVGHLSADRLTSDCS